MERNGCALYAAASGRDPEGVVAKLKNGRCTPRDTTWVKIKNPTYSQAEGRAELLDRTVARNSQEILSKDVMPLGGLSKRANQPEGYGIRPDTHRAILG